MLHSEVDHLVVAAASLAEGLAWCEETFGFAPTAGGAHPLMSTHNRVFAIGSPAFARSYLEIMAIDPAAAAPGRARWFDLDDTQMREVLAAGPRLVHFVARTNDAVAATSALRERGIERGTLLAAERATPQGMLRWKITVRDDGRRLHDGVMPTLIEWGDMHPCDNLPDCGIALRSVEVMHPQAAALQAAYHSIGLAQPAPREAAANLVAVLDTPRGRVRLESQGA
ncbi:MAG TPA: VOC family protein [Ramlibacter sp.]|jgi:hypothetical protein